MDSEKREVSKTNLKYYDRLVRSWTAKQITNALKNLGSALRVLGRVDDVGALSSIESPQIGDVYLVGAAGEPPFDMFYYTPSGTWEFLDSTSISVDSMVTAYDLYKGGDSDNPGSGTIQSPADGTILRPIYDKIAIIKATKFSIDTSKWVESDKIAYPYMATIEDASITIGNEAVVHFDLECQDTIESAEVHDTPIMSNGGLIIYAKKVPNETITGFYVPFAV